MMLCWCRTPLLWRLLHDPISNWCIVLGFNFMVTVLWVSIVPLCLMLVGTFWLIVAIFMYSLLFLIILKDLFKIGLWLVEPINPILCSCLVFFPFVWWIERWASISLLLNIYVWFINDFKKWAVKGGKLIVSLRMLTQTWWSFFFWILYNQAKMLIE
jgi:hypothetical protein